MHSVPSYTRYRRDNTTTSRDEKCVGEGREEDTTEERWDGERELRFRLKVTGKGVGGTLVAKCDVNLMKNWSEICISSVM